MAKVTKRERFEEIFGILADNGNTELAEFVAGEITKLDKRAAAPRTLTADQLANIEVKDNIVTVLANTDGTRAGDVAKILDVSVQKVTALLRQLVLDGAVDREADGKTTLFRLAR